MYTLLQKERVQDVLKEDYEVLSVHKGEELVSYILYAAISNEGSYKWLPRYRSRFCNGR